MTDTRIPDPMRSRPSDGDDANPARGAGSNGVEAIETGGRLLAALAATPGPSMLRDLAAAAGMAPAKAHRYLASFVRIGMVARDEDTGRYAVGPLAVRLGLAGLERHDVLRVAQRRLARLRDLIDQSVALAVWTEQGPMIVRWLAANQPVSASLREGATMPLTRSATGRVFAAFGGSSRLPALIEQELRQNASAGLVPARAADFQPLIERVRVRGMARVQGDLVGGIDAIAAPLFAREGELAASVVALGHSGRFDARWSGPVAHALATWSQSVGNEAGLATRVGLQHHG